MNKDVPMDSCCASHIYNFSNITVLQLKLAYIAKLAQFETIISTNNTNIDFMSVSKKVIGSSKF